MYFEFIFTILAVGSIVEAFQINGSSEYNSKEVNVRFMVLSFYISLTGYILRSYDFVYNYPHHAVYIIGMHIIYFRKFGEFRYKLPFFISSLFFSSLSFAFGHFYQKYFIFVTTPICITSLLFYLSVKLPKWVEK